MTKTGRVIGKAEAAQILLSALNYCLKSGLDVRVTPNETGLTLHVTGLGLVSLENGKHEFTPLATDTK